MLADGAQIKLTPALLSFGELRLVYFYDLFISLSHLLNMEAPGGLPVAWGQIRCFLSQDSAAVAKSFPRPLK